MLQDHVGHRVAVIESWRTNCVKGLVDHRTTITCMNCCEHLMIEPHLIAEDAISDCET